MSVEEGLALKAAVVAALNRVVPHPVTTQEWQTRHFALADALADELAAWLVARHPGVLLPEKFVQQEFISFAAELLVPFAVTAAQRRGAAALMTPVIAILAKRATDDGLMEFNEDIPLGKAYRVDLDTRCTVMLFNVDQQVQHRKEIVYVIDCDGWLPIECLALRVS